MADDKADMIDVQLQDFQFGHVQFVKGTPGTPELVQQDANITVRTPGKPPRPPHFKVHFNVSVSCTLDGSTADSFLSLDVPVPATSDDPRYSEVEDEAARTLPLLLRSVADLIETANGASETPEGPEQPGPEAPRQ